MNVLGFPGGSAIKNLPATKEIQETQVWSLGLGDSLEEEMSTLSSIIAWKIPWTEEPGGLQSRELQRVIHDWVTEHTHRDHRDECIKVKEYTIEKLKKKTWTETITKELWYSVLITEMSPILLCVF